MSEQKSVPPSSGGICMLVFAWLTGLVLLGSPAVYLSISLISAGSPVVFVILFGVMGLAIWWVSWLRKVEVEKPYPLISLVFSLLAIIDICLLLFAPFRAALGPPADWIGPLGITVLVLFILWRLRTERALVDLMSQRPPLDKSAAGLSQEQVAPLPEVHSIWPVPPFATTMLNAGNLPVPSAAAAVLIQRAHKRFDGTMHMLKQGMWFLMGGHIALALLCGILNNLDFSLFPISTYCVWLFIWLMFVSPTFGNIYRGRSRMTLTLQDWRGRNVERIIPLALLILVVMVQPYAFLAAGLLPEAFQPFIVAMVTSILAVLAPVAAVILVGYMLWIARALARLRPEARTHPPLKLLFLWVFRSSLVQNSLRNNLGGLWQFLGSVQLLKGAGFMVGVSEMTATLRGRADERIEETPDEVMARIKAFRMMPDWMGRYCLNSILCGDAVWQLALHTLLADTDVVLINLASFSPKNRGVTYELGQLINRLPTRRFLLLVDETTDIEFLMEMLRDAWTTMTADSPNRLPDTAPVQIFKVEHLNKPRQSSGESGSGTDYAALQAEIDGIFQILCEGAVQASDQPV